MPERNMSGVTAAPCRTATTMRQKPRSRRWAVLTSVVSLVVGVGVTAHAAPPDSTDAGGEEWETVVAEANEEGVVVMYTYLHVAEQQSLEAAFEAAYPEIDLQLTRMLSEQEATLDAERETGASGADVGNTAVRLTAEKYLVDDALLPLNGPNAQLWEGNEHFTDGHYFVSNAQAIGIGWNTDLVDEPLESYEDLLRPELAGRVGLPDGTASGSLQDFYLFLEEHHGGEAFLREFAAQDPIIYDTAAPLGQALVSGEIAAAGYLQPSILLDQEAGAPVEFILPDPVWVAPFYAFGVEWAEHPNAARLLLDFLMSLEGQEAVAITGTSMLDGVPGMTTIDQAVLSRGGERTPEEIEEYAEVWREIFRS